MHGDGQVRPGRARGPGDLEVGEVVVGHHDHAVGALEPDELEGRGSARVGRHGVHPAEALGLGGGIVTVGPVEQQDRHVGIDVPDRLEIRHADRPRPYEDHVPAHGSERRSRGTHEADDGLDDRRGRDGGRQEVRDPQGPARGGRPAHRCPEIEPAEDEEPRRVVDPREEGAALRCVEPARPHAAEERSDHEGEHEHDARDPELRPARDPGALRGRLSAHRSSASRAISTTRARCSGDTPATNGPR